MSNSAQWRITFPIAKAEQREDGFFLVGEATGPEIDSEDERMAPEAIERFAAQIAEMAAAGQPLVYRDAHKPDGVLRDLGEITRAWINESFHLGVEVKLDMTNPAAQYLWVQLTEKKKQYGMSVAGRVLDFADEFVAEVGKRIRTYKHVLLTEISNTTRPAWTPSFGTVLAKAIEEAEKSAFDADEGDSTLMSDELRNDAQETQEASAAEETSKAEDIEQPAEEDSTEKAEESEVVEDDVTEKADDDSAEENVEKAGRAISNKNAQRLLALHTEMTNALRELGVIADEDTPEKSVSGDEAETLDKSSEEKSETDLLKAQVEDLNARLAEATAAIEELKQNRTVLPPVIERAEGKRDDVMKALAELSPSERLRIGLALAKGETLG